MALDSEHKSNVKSEDVSFKNCILLWKIFLKFTFSFSPVFRLYRSYTESILYLNCRQEKTDTIYLKFLPEGQTFLSPLLQFHFLFNILYLLFCNLSSTLGANLDILEDNNCKIKDKYCRRGDKVVEEEIKRFQSLIPSSIT